MSASTPDARADIADLVHRYAHGVRRRAVAELIALFAEDASFEVRLAAEGGPGSARQARVDGRAAILDFLHASVGAGAAVWPLVHNLVIQVDGAVATGNCVMVGADATGRPQFMGVYEDGFRREDRWLFASRVFTIMGRRG